MSTLESPSLQGLIFNFDQFQNSSKLFKNVILAILSSRKRQLRDMNKLKNAVLTNFEEQKLPFCQILNTVSVSQKYSIWQHCRLCTFMQSFE